MGGRARGRGRRRGAGKREREGQRASGSGARTLTGIVSPPKGRPQATPWERPRTASRAATEIVSDAADGDDETPAPPWAKQSAPVAATGDDTGIPSLQEILCGWLARHLHAIEDLDYLPPHLAALVRQAIQRDRSLLKEEDDLAVWLAAVFDDGDCTRLSLRWAAALSDAALCVIGSRPEWSRTLLSLDLAYCEAITDEGICSIAEGVSGLEALTLAGCRKCGDGAANAIGLHLHKLKALNMELLNNLTDAGAQAVVRGCGRQLEELLLGGCSKLTSVSIALAADHGKGTLRRLGLGGLRDLCDPDCEDIGRCNKLEWLELRACGRVSDSGIKFVGMLAARQTKARAQWEANNDKAGTSLSSGGDSGGTDGSGSEQGPPRVLTHLDLGGLTRLSDVGLEKLLARAIHVRTLDLRGCSRLSADGLSRALLGLSMQGVPTTAAVDLPLSALQRITLNACSGATPELKALIDRTRPDVKIVG